MDNTINKKDWLNNLRSFFISELFMLIMCAVACIVTIFNIEVIGVFIFVFIITVQLVVCDDLLAPTLPFLLLAETVIKCYDSYNTFIKIIWIAVFLVAALIFHFIYYRQKIILGKGFYPILFVSIAVTLGGLGFISAKEYFSLVSFYYVFGLGFGMLIIYVILNTYLNTERKYSLKAKFTDIMVYMGLFAAFMIFEYYFRNINEVIETHGILYMQWRNNISTYLMLAMPFAAFKSVKRPPYILLALLFYVGILLAGSRGGLLFGGIEFAMTISVLIGIDKKHRLTFIAIIAGILLAVVIFFQDFYGFFSETINRLIQAVMGISGNEKEVRVSLFSRAFQDFKSNPFFGTGLAYMGNRDVHPSAKFALCWYHCEPLQVMASLGLVGIAAFSVQLIFRFIHFLKKRTVFNLAVLISYIGLEMMSLVNPGIFCPLPYLFMITMYIAVVEVTNRTEASDSLKSDIEKKQASI